MDIELIQRQKQQIVSRFGEWTAHNIQLYGDLYTIDKRITGDEIKLRRIVQAASDIAGKPLRDLRILDLACLEGLYAIEFARHGAEVVAIEGRQANIEKARFAKEVLSLENLELVQGDVRELGRERYGSFDVVLCLGILYHLDVPDLFHFLESVSDVCQGFALVDTHVSLKSEESHVYGEREYSGRRYVEHRPGATAEEREKALWASVDNPTSFWLTRPSLYNLLSDAGFTSAYECYIPEEPEKPADRITILAAKGHRQELISCPLVNAEPFKGLSEECAIDRPERPFGRLDKVSRLIPGPVKRFIGKMLYP